MHEFGSRPNYFGNYAGFSPCNSLRADLHRTGTDGHGLLCLYAKTQRTQSYFDDRSTKVA